MSDADVAQLIAAVVLLALIAGLAVAGRTDQVPNVEGAGTRPQKRSWLGAILAGKDNRTSTSKTVVFAWTFAIAFGLLSLLIADWLGDHGPWDAQVDRGIQEEYLLLLGGPFAAAILAKVAAINQTETKPDAPVGAAKPDQLVSDDEGNTDLGDFQYVLFNLIGLAFFFGAFIGDLAEGFPVLPAILTGLVLTSTGGYAAKKLIAQATPAMTSVVPAAARAGAADVKVFGTQLIVPGCVSETGEPIEPTVFVGGRPAEVTAQDQVLGNDRLTITVPEDATPGSAPISVARADGAAARGPGAANVLPFEVLEPPAEKKVEQAPEPLVATGAEDKDGQSAER
jgi:hypothetical protein